MTAAAVVVIISFAYFVQAAFGFGAGLLAIPLLSLVMDAKEAVIVVTLFSALSGLLVFKLWKDIDWRQVRWLTPSLLAGLGVGLALFSIIDRKLLGIVLAVYIIAFVANDVLKPSAVARIGRMMPVRVQSTVSGFAGGLIQGVMGTGGPTIVTYLKAHARSIDQFRATVVCVFLIANVLRIVVMGSASLIHGKILAYALTTVPFFGLATYLGYHLPGRLNEKNFHHIIDALLFLSAVSILVKARL